MDKFIFTNKGLEYAAKTATGSILMFTKGKFGDGTAGGDIAKLTDLVKPLGELQISKKMFEGNQVTIETQFTNTTGRDSTLPAFHLKEIGLFAKLQTSSGADDPKYPETLVCYARSEGSDIGDYIPTTPTEFIINWPFSISNADNVKITVGLGAFALQTDLDNAEKNFKNHKESSEIDHPDSSVTNRKIKDGAITESKLAGGAVTHVKLAENSVWEANLGRLSVTNDKIANDAVTFNKIQDGAILDTKIADSAVGTGKIHDRAVTNVKIGKGAVEHENIADNAVWESQLGQLSVTNEKIANDAVTSNKILDGAVTSSEISDNAVTESKIHDRAVTSNKIASAAVSHSNLADNSVWENNLGSQAVTNDKIANDAVTSNKIASGAIYSAKLASGAVLHSHLAENSVWENNLGSQAVTSGKIKDANVTKPKLSAELQTEINGFASRLEKLELSEAGYIAGISVKVEFYSINTVTVSWWEGKKENKKNATHEGETIYNGQEYHIGVGTADIDDDYTSLLVSSDKEFGTFYSSTYLFSFDGINFGTFYIHLTPEILKMLQRVQ